MFGFLDNQQPSSVTDPQLPPTDVDVRTENLSEGKGLAATGMDTVTSYWNSAKVQMGVAPSEEKGLFDEMSDSMSLSPSQRLGGFVMLFVFGIVCIAISVALVPTLVLVPKKFAFFVTMGNFFLVASSAILIGPMRQLRSMGESHRQHAAAVFVLSMAMTLIAAVQWRSYVLSIVFTAMQSSAFVWYVLSYIPFARQFAKTCYALLAKVLGPIISQLSGLLLQCCGQCGKLCCRWVTRS